METGTRKAESGATSSVMTAVGALEKERSTPTTIKRRGRVVVTLSEVRTATNFLTRAHAEPNPPCVSSVETTERKLVVGGGGPSEL